MITGRFVLAAKAIEDSVIVALPLNELNKIIERDYKSAYLFMKQVAILVSNRLVKMHYQLDIAKAGYM